MHRSQIPHPEHSVGDQLHGFTIEAVTELADIRALEEVS